MDDLSPTQSNPLRAFFLPRSIVMVGATERPNSVGQAIVRNLSTFGGDVYFVNPYQQQVVGERTYDTVEEISDDIDLALIASPPETVPGIIRACDRKGIGAAIVISAGFHNNDGDLRRAIRQSKVRVIGPNSMGLMRPAYNLNTTFSGVTPQPGQIAFVSQSGALGTAILSRSAEDKVGFSAFVSLGDMFDVGWEELFGFLRDDTKTRSIILYMEAIRDPQAFISAAREVALTKPIIVIKGGRTSAGAEAAQAHTASQIGDDAVLDGAFQRCGLLRVEAIVDAFYVAEVLAKQPRPRGRKLTVITNGGGPGVLATDSLTSSGGALADLGPNIIATLDDVLPSQWSRRNPIDVLGDANSERYAEVFNTVMRQAYTDGILVILSPQAMSEPTLTAKKLKPFARIGKTVLACWMGGKEVGEAHHLLSEAGIPSFAYPDTAARVFNYLWQYSDNLKALYEVPVPAVEPLGQNTARLRGRSLLNTVTREGRITLTEPELADLLRIYDLPLGHATEGYELSLYSHIDSRFGPVVMLGLGGHQGQLTAPQGIGLPPLNTILARRMMERTELYPRLQRRVPSLDELERVLVRFSQLIADQPWIKEARIDPLIVDEERVSVAHVSLTLFPAGTPSEELAHPTIRPYPGEYIQLHTMRDGTDLLFRPIRPEDEPRMVDFQRTLSEKSVRMRYFSVLNITRRTEHDWLSRACAIDYAREIRVVAEVPETHEIMGSGQLVFLDEEEAEYAVIVSDQAQGKGLGTTLLQYLLDIAQQEGRTRVIGYILFDNQAMLHVARKLGFVTEKTIDPQVVKAVYHL